MANSNSRVQGITIEIGGETTKLQDSLKKVNSTISKTQSSLKDVNTLLKLDPKNTELLKQKQELLAEGIEATKKKLEDEKKALESLKNADNSSETIKQQQALEREIIATTQELEKLESKSKEAADTLGNSMKAAGEKISAAGDKIKGAGEALSGIGQGMTTKVTAPIAAVGTASILAASNFEDAMAKVSTIADSTEVPLDELGQAITELSNETGISASEIADNVYNAISAGQKTGDAVEFVSNATKLAKAGFTDSASALDILTTTLNAYGMEASEVTKVSDVLINTQNLGKTTVGELAAAMGKVIPTAKSQGVELETLAGAYAVMTANGIKTAETTTYMNSMLNELGKQGTTAAEAFAKGTEHIKKGGLTMAEAMEEGWSLTDVLSILSEQADESGTSIANMFGSAEAGKAANVLWDNAEKLNDAIAQMETSAGATDEAFAKLDTTSYEAQKSLNLIKNTSIEFGTQMLEMLAPTLEKVSDGISKLTGWLNSLDEGQKQTLITVLAVVAAIGPVLIIVGKVIAVVGSVVSGIGTLVTVLGTVSTFITATAIPAVVGFVATFWPVIAVIGAVVVAVVGVIAVIKNWGKITEWFQEKWEALGEKVAGIKETFINLKDQAKDWGKDMLQNFIDGITEKIAKLKEAASNVATAISERLHFSVPDVGPLKDADTWMPDMVDLLSTTLNRSAKNIEPSLDNFASAISSGVRNGMSEVSMGSGGAGPVSVNVTLQGDASKFFRAMQDQNRDYKMRTGNSAFA